MHRHIRIDKLKSARTSSNWVAYKRLNPETLCGAEVTDKDSRISDVIRNGRFTLFGKNWEFMGGCPKCIDLLIKDKGLNL